MRAPGASYLTVWHRGAADPATTELPVPHLRGQRVIPQLRYPSASPASPRWDPARGTLAVSLPRTPAACLVALADQVTSEHGC